ncbi:9012_t:CDS:2 [Funneliformis geosporum]|uniref:19358_t:CDS:1 n=1 Tax=Funneliformis geosporum TaxID=1117311 RepID=A0A9W4WMV5_9GLOM|nr:9012_t:CDS:2 [Funneliformis geosporum]CAI2173718.1 19358_t:CDS:2 [Funneliformis geosporum]
MRDKIARAVEEYIDEHRDKLAEIVERNLVKLKAIIIDELPEKIMEFLKKRIDDGDDEHDTFLENVLKTITSLTGKLSDDFKDDVRENVRRNLDEATEDSADQLTDIITTESKKQMNFGFLRDGKEGIITKVMELIRPPVHRSGEDIDEKISDNVPKHVKKTLLNKVGGNIFSSKKDADAQSRGLFSKSSGKDEEGGNKFSKILKVFDGKEGNFIDRMFAKLPDKVSEFLRPYLENFERSLLESVGEEFRNNIFRDDKFKNDVKNILLKFGDPDGDGKNFFTEAADAVSSIFKKKKDRDV